MSSNEKTTPTREPDPSQGTVPNPAKRDQSLKDYELSGGKKRPPFILTWQEVKLLGIAGVSTQFIGTFPLVLNTY